MAAATNQVRLDFNNITERGLKPLLQLFQRNLLPVSSVDATNVAKRESGTPVKDFTLTFQDGQSVLIRVKSDGTVFQVKLNNKVVPIKHVDDMAKAVVEVCDYVQGNEKKFAAAKMQRDKQVKIKLDTQPVTTSRAAKIEQLQQALQQAQGDVAAGQQNLDTQTKTRDSDAAILAELQAQLQEETDKTTQLQDELKSLQEAA